jgi:1,4-dihydroxy-2-naphthoyl-CoA hydrolase
MIWYNKNITIASLQNLGNNTMGSHLGMQFIEIGENYLVGTMPVDERTKQPYGLLHGGASVALAETLGSVASALIINPDKQIAVGLEINANHLKGVKDGYVIGKATPLHIGASTHVWEIKITTPDNKLVCVSRLTVAILQNKKATN